MACSSSAHTHSHSLTLIHIHTLHSILNSTFRQYLVDAAAAAAATGCCTQSERFPSISITYHDHRTFVEIGCAMHTSVFPFIFILYINTISECKQKRIIISRLILIWMHTFKMHLICFILF